MQGINGGEEEREKKKAEVTGNHPTGGFPPAACSLEAAFDGMLCASFFN